MFEFLKPKGDMVDCDIKDNNKYYGWGIGTIVKEGLFNEITEQDAKNQRIKGAD